MLFIQNADYHDIPDCCNNVYLHQCLKISLQIAKEVVFYTGQRKQEAESNLISTGFIHASDDLLTLHSWLCSLALRMGMTPAKRMEGLEWEG